MRLPSIAWAALGAVGGCIPRTPGPAPGRAAAESEAGGILAQLPSPPTPLAPPVSPGKADPKAPKGLLTTDEARAYMVKLINRDRASAGLAAVALELGPAQRAGQLHADDMAAHGYLGHWGTDGSVPEQRFTEAGGNDMVLENASCFTDERRRTLDRAPRIDPKTVEQAEDMFFHETPPHDGHRRNILKPWHKTVGIGVAQPEATPTEIPVPCFAQEFVDSYGTYLAVPRRARVGQTLSVGGTIAPPATFAGVGLARVGLPKAITVSELNQRRSYPVPAPYQMYWPPGFQTPVPVRVDGAHFAIDLPLSDAHQPGLYELSVWVTMPGSPDFVMVSLRAIQVRP